ncbi:MAG: hypothetical protein LBU97_02355 [Alistipes sp.]|jgi:hypothetical protein|nr:hypothetical protein [Alistipes sp.]
MLRPAIINYIDALENPPGLFRTLGEPAVERDVWGVPQLRAGNSAAIFTYLPDTPDISGGRRRFLKCYVRPNPYLRTIYDYIERRRPVLLPEMRLLREELFVETPGGETGWVDIVEGEWTPGETLSVAVGRAAMAGDTTRLEALAAAFDGLWARLLAVEWAHGDLKPENIIVRPDGELILIDADAVWIPELAGLPAVETGTPGYRHPARTAEWFDKRIDDFPARIISDSLRALALRPELYAARPDPDMLLFSAKNY